MPRISHGFTNGLISFRSSLSGKCARLRFAIGSEFLRVRHPQFMSLLSFTPRRSLKRVCR